MSSRGKPFPPEVRERAVRMVLEHQGEYDSQWAAITSIAEKFGMTAETLRKWVRRAEVDAGARPGLSTDERPPDPGRFTESVARASRAMGWPLLATTSANPSQPHPIAPGIRDIQPRTG